MTVQERKERALQKKKRQLAKRRMVILLATVLFITVGSIIFGSIFTSAKTDKVEEEYKYYKSIIIEKGDSLWSIAKEYRPETYSTKEYISELKKLNDLASDTIHAGQHLMITYYDTEYR